MKITFPSGRVIDANHGLASNRQKKPGPPPSLLRMAWRYTKAISRWRGAGAPLRAQTEIDETLAICRRCEFFVERQKPFCAICGCQLNNLRSGLANKIAMATEHCPLDPPRW